MTYLTLPSEILFDRLHTFLHVSITITTCILISLHPLLLAFCAFAQVCAVFAYQLTYGCVKAEVDF